MRPKPIILVAVILVIAALVLWYFLRGGNRNDTVHIAVVSSETGDLAEIGKDMSRGAIMAIEEANANGGVRGRKIEYHLFDDQGDPKTAVSVANLICQDKRIVAVVGHLTSGCMSAAAPVYSRANLAVVMPVPTNPEITRKGAANLFRVPPTDADQAPYLARYLLSKDPDAPVAVVDDLTAYGVGFATQFRDAFVKGGGTVVAFEGVQKEARDFRTLITKLQTLNPRYIVLGATYDMGAPFVRQLRELGVDATVLAGDGCYGTEFIKQAAGAAEGSIVSFIAPDRTSSPKTEEFFAKFEAKYGKVVSFAPLGYDAGNVVVRALRESKTLDRAGVLETLRSPGFVVDGVTGEIRFAANGDNENKNLTLYVVKNGRFVSLKE
jgi:branched-chain amino acid transport system substrate-binding protein